MMALPVKRKNTLAYFENCSAWGISTGPLPPGYVCVLTVEKFGSKSDGVILASADIV